MINNNLKNGFSLAELLVVLGISILLIVVVLNIFVNFKNQDTVLKSSELLVETLREARSLTLNSKNSSEYGVRVSSGSITLFKGQTYSPSETFNKTIQLFSGVSASASLNGGGTDIVFKKLSGQTDKYGTITLTNSSSGQTKNVIIYKTGLVE